MPALKRDDLNTTQPTNQLAKTDPQRKIARRRGNAPPPIRASRRAGQEPPKKGGALKAVLVLLVLAVAGAGVYKKFIMPPPAPPADPHDAERKQAAVLLQAAKADIRKGQWHAAEPKLREAETLAPEIDGLKAYVDAMVQEIPAQDRLDAAERALDKGDLERTMRELNEVSKDTRQYTRRGELSARAYKQVDEYLAEGRGLIGQTGNKEKMTRLKYVAEQVLAVKADDRDALALLQTAKRALGPKVAVTVAVDPTDPAKGVIEQYVSGNPAAAFASAEACANDSSRCASLKTQLPEMIETLKKVESLDAAGLERGMQLDLAISGGRLSVNGKPIGVRLAAVLLPKASAAAARKQWGLAIATAKKILVADPGNTGAQSIVDQGYRELTELYQRAYISRHQSPEEALPMLQEVANSLPEGDSLRQKADNILQEMKQK